MSIVASGRPAKDDDTILNSVGDSLDELTLMWAITRGESIRYPAKPDRARQRYSPIYKHPLPPSERRYNHEYVLRKVLCCKIENQVAAAVAMGDPWVLEEVYLRGAPAEVSSESGFKPVHLAVQKNQHGCLMVLINIGVDINAASTAGVTPLYLAMTAGATQTMQVLLERGAVARNESSALVPGSTVLETRARSVRIDKVALSVGLPSSHDMF